MPAPPPTMTAIRPPVPPAMPVRRGSANPAAALSAPNPIAVCPPRIVPVLRPAKREHVRVTSAGRPIMTATSPPAPRAMPVRRRSATPAAAPLTPNPTAASQLPSVPPLHLPARRQPASTMPARLQRIPATPPAVRTAMPVRTKPVQAAGAAPSPRNPTVA
jgi:hypothetical protein